MKTTKEIDGDSRKRTGIECQSCGAKTYVKAGIGTKMSKAAIERFCRAHSTPQNLPINQGWWLEFGLDKNPYIYGPMQRLRTGFRYWIEEATRMGYMAWVWHNEYEGAAKVFNHNYRRIIKRNLSMSNYLDK